MTCRQQQQEKYRSNIIGDKESCNVYKTSLLVQVTSLELIDEVEARLKVSDLYSSMWAS